MSVGTQSGAIESIAISPDGRTVATGSQDGLVRLWSLEMSGAGSILPGPAFTGMVTDLAFSSDGTRIAASSQDGTSRVWSISDRRIVLETPPERLRNNNFYANTSIDFSPDGATLLTGGMRTKVWPLPSHEGRLVLRDDYTLFARFSANGRDLITGGRDGSIVRWDSKSLRQIEVAVKNDHALSIMRYCGDPLRVAIADEIGRAYIHYLGRDNAVLVFGSGKRPVMALVFARDDRTVFAGLGRRGAARGRLERWDIESGVPKAPRASGLDGYEDLWLLTPSGDGATLEIETRDEKLLTWDTKRDVQVGPPRALGFDVKRLADLSIAREKQISPDSVLGTWFDERRRGVSSKSTSEKAPGSSAFAEEDGPTSHLLQTVSTSPAGNLKVSTGLDGTVEILNVTQGRTVTRMFGHIGAVRSAKFSPDGTLVATAGDDGTTRLWDVKTGAAVAVFTGHEGPVLAVGFSHDGERIATGGYDGTIRIYPVRPAGILALACSRLRGTEAWARVEERCGWTGAVPGTLGAGETTAHTALPEAASMH